MSMKKIFLFLVAALLFFSCRKQESKALEYDNSDFVRVTDVIPDAILEIRYYSTYNFVGERIDGYELPIALMTREAADSLKAVNDELKANGYRIKIWDTYRPQRAVNHFIRWAENISDTAMKAVFYPMVYKALLFEQGYIYSWMPLAERSWIWVRLSTGSARRAIRIILVRCIVNRRTARSCIMRWFVTALKASIPNGGILHSATNHIRIRILIFRFSK